MNDPVLVACSHGTRSAAGREVVEELRAAVRRARPGLEVHAAHVDVQEPELGAVLAALTAAGRTSVVVPLLLSSGYHVRVDIADALRDNGPHAVAAPALGPGDAVTDVVVDRLEQALGSPLADFDGAVVLAAAGSSDARAAADVDAAVASLGRRLGRPVTSGFLSAQTPTVPEAVAAARAAGASRVAVAGYLLAPGVFSARLAAAGADVVAAPMGPHPGLVRLVLDRFDTAVAQLAPQTVPAS
ncbi:sirohydrochlorin chelatase [Kineococcus rubinsiae]|uniref:sirohydrochlorin chelatase n=1 Tax=Kineococcus rubinsiae TaxID=2609562 RepID=UPI001431647B|nr:CbiX/SirB N-terminal domain-containing protein [Kineococcus rubinsiae]NIZ90221.1 sirohydrochlorin chelatase [Kineococcus rubinsiae]